MSSDSPGNAEPRNAHTDAPRTSLHICPECGSILVHPRAIEIWGADSWWLELRCPECGWMSADVFRQQAIEEFETRLGQAEHELRRRIDGLAADAEAERAVLEARLRELARRIDETLART